MKSFPMPYLRTMFATCMLFNVLYILCVVLWLFFPELSGHAMLETIFPGFKFLSMASFCYGLVLSSIYGWFVAIVFVFFFNLWPKFVHALFGSRNG